MKILLALPLLVLLGCALAQVNNHAQSCTNGHCIQCLNGVCTKSHSKRGVVVESSSTSTSQSCNNGVCSASSTECHNGDCTYNKREAEGVTSTTRNCDNHGCTVCVNGKCNREKREEPIYPPSCRTMPAGPGCKKPREVEHSTSTSCNNINGRETCTVCENGDCHQTSSKREANCNICPQCCPPYELTPDKKKREATDEDECRVWLNNQCYKRKREVQDGTRLDCTNTVPTAIGIPHCVRVPKHSNFTNATCGHNCSFCVDGLCYKDKRDADQYVNVDCTHSTINAMGIPHCVRIPKGAAEGTSSSNCNTLNGHKTCTICTDGVCHKTSKREDANCNICPQCCPPYELTPDKREAGDHNLHTSTDCNNDGCNVCVNGRCHFKPKGSKREAGNRPYYRNCVNGRCIVCKYGVCHDDRKREAQNHSSSLNCNNGQCTKCVNGACHTYQQ